MGEDQVGYVKLDFVRFFPHKFWISTWGSDPSYPEGFRYKLLTVRDEKRECIEIILLLEQRDGDKQEMHRATIDLRKADDYARIFWKGLEEEHGLSFEEQDFTAVRSIVEFNEAVAAHDWDCR